MEIPSAFISPPIDIGQVIVTGPVLASSPTKSFSSGPGSDVDSAMGERPKSSRKSKPRSRTGCWTCRQRKVKCDEIQPKCGSCTRLNKDCGWGQRWKFDNLSIRTQRRNKHVSTEGSPSWDDSNSSHISARRLYVRHNESLPRFTELISEDDREKKALTQPPGTYNVVLTPDSFSQLPEYGGLIRRFRSSSAGSQPGSTHILTDDPNLIILSEFEDTPYFMALPDRKPSFVDCTAQISFVPMIQRDFLSHGTREVDNCMTHYKDFISKKIMPLGSKFRLSDCGHEDVVVLQSHSFQPLYHAICAITLLSLALKGQRHLLAGAFQHYHQAISAAMSCSSMAQGSLLYLHFILLLYDICCATQNCGPDGQMWSQHFQQLGRLAYSHDMAQINELQAYLLWYTLYLDAQSCLSGNPESGSFVRAYQMQGSNLPTWRQGHNSPQKSPDAAGLTTIFALSRFMCSQFAELSQLALRMREDVELGRGSVAEHQHSVTRFRNHLTSSWALKYPAFLPRDSPEAGTQLPVLARTVFDFATMQYSTAMVYLHTSMYNHQRTHATPLQRKETASHCRHILTMATQIIAAKSTDHHHIIFPVFLAGVNSTNDHDKNRALGILRAMEGTGISCNVSKSRELFEAVCNEQKNRVRFGGSAAEVDWISFARQHGFRTVNLGL